MYYASSVLTGKTKVAEYPNIALTTPVTVVSNTIESTITLPPGKSGAVIPFITSISTNKDEAMDCWNIGECMKHLISEKFCWWSVSHYNSACVMQPFSGQSPSLNYVCVCAHACMCMYINMYVYHGVMCRQIDLS